MKKFLLMLMTAFFIFAASGCHTGSPPKSDKQMKTEMVVQKSDAVQMVQVADRVAGEVYYVRDVSNPPEVSEGKYSDFENAGTQQLKETNRVPIVRAVYKSDQVPNNASIYLTQAVDSTGNQEGGGVGIFDYIYNNWGLIASILLLLSELIGGSKLKSNSIYQLLFPFLRNSATRVKD